MDNTTLEGGIMVTPALDTATGFVTTGDLYWLTSIGVSSSCSSILTEIEKSIIITNCEVFVVSMIPVAEDRTTAAIGPEQCSAVTSTADSSTPPKSIQS